MWFMICAMKPCRCDLVECTEDMKQIWGGFIDASTFNSMRLTYDHKVKTIIYNLSMVVH